MIQFSLFLLDTSMINFLIVSLFAQFIIGWTSFFSNYSCFIKFIL